MAPTRQNHYVPQWYQEGFLLSGRRELAYLDMSPEQHVLADGRVVLGRSLFNTPTSRAFVQTDLYSTFFGTCINDEIERRLFGDIDTRGSAAIRAFAGTDAAKWHQHFQTFFEYLDIQKTRTPKGLDWLRAQYLAPTQNELMHEMQAIRMMHCTIWTEGVREIVSAESSEIKFIISDHPVTIYNHAAPPGDPLCSYPFDPSITLKASQTLFPLSQDFCLILTNLEYARDPSCAPLEKRKFARHFRTSMVRTDAFIRERQLNSVEVIQINQVLKSRARRFVAAGRKEWLYPERTLEQEWTDFKQILVPPQNRGLFHFGGEIFAKFNDGRNYYQDEFGRKEKQREFLVKPALSTEPNLRDPCGCGSGLCFRNCCRLKPIALRPSWDERSIRERNIMLFNAISNVLGLDEEKDWVTIRREITDAKISEVYSLFAGLWPTETNLLNLLPKPDGLPRAVYTGQIHPNKIIEIALGVSLYFGQTLIQHPFLHAENMRSEHSPIEHPELYRHEFLKSVIFFMTVFPLVEIGMVNLVPDPCYFDSHLQRQMFAMARHRSQNIKIDRQELERGASLMQEDLQRSIMSLPREALAAFVRKSSPGLTSQDLEEFWKDLEVLKANDPLAVLQSDGAEKKSGQMNLMELAPNFEMALYLAQATGASIVTDNRQRWDEIQNTIRKPSLRMDTKLPALAAAMTGASFTFPQQPSDLERLSSLPDFIDFRAIVRDAFKYLAKPRHASAKPNYEQGLASRFSRAHNRTQTILRKQVSFATPARISCSFPEEGIQDHTVNRLLLMSSSDQHLPAVPMAFFVKPQISDVAAK